MIKRTINDISKYFRYSVVAAKAKLKAEVAGSYLNWIWWVLEPFCFMLIYTFIFGYVFNSKEEHFPVYIFTSLTLWNFFNKTVQSSVRMIKSNKAIVSKVYFPKYILLLTTMWVNAFKMMISFCLVICMMVVFRIPVTWNVLYSVPILCTLGLFTFGCGCFLMHWGVYVNDLYNVIHIVMRMLFYLTGIFYDLEKRIPVYGSLLITYNPVAFLINNLRNCLIYGQTPKLIGLLIWFTISLLLSIAGIRKIYKEENSYVKAI